MIDETKVIEDRNIRTKKLAKEALHTARGRIVANMRFMDPAVFALEDRESVYGFRTDGSTLYYEPSDVLKRCASGISGLTHDQMHVLLHCVFKHYFLKGKIFRKYWDLAVDVAVEEVIASFGNDCFKTDRTDERKEALALLRRDRGRLSAEKLYRTLMDEPLPGKDYTRLAELFRVDDHSLWYERSKPRLVSGNGNSADGNGSESGGEAEDADGSAAEGSEIEAEAADDSFNGMSEGAELLSAQDWEKISELVKTELETEDKGMGSGGGTMLRELEEARREHIDYSSFLRKFAARRETLKVDDGSFDYIFYTYGLELYGDMPLIEPLEYSDEKQIRDLVIAIDTSGSTDGPLVRSFIRKSFDILQNNEVIKSRFNIHVIQCDAVIQEDVVLRTRDDVERYIENMEIKGLGGTDFRPVFTYVDRLLDTGAVTDLRGLLYFTDGKGIFPKKKPPYDTAFIFVGDEAAEIEVPPWAIKVEFDEGGEQQ